MTRIAVIALAGAFTTYAGAAPPVKSETATSGDVRATIVYRIVAGEATHRVRISIDRAGNRVLDERVPPYSRESAGIWPGIFGGRKSVVVRDLDGDGEPEIVLDLHWGGAHCCWWSRIYRWLTGANGYTPIIHLWGDVAYRLVYLDEDRHEEFVTADTRFAYAFASFAESAFPVQIWTYHSGRLVDPTRRHPDLSRRDAAKQWHTYGKARRTQRNVLGVLTAWTADKCLLGRGDEALARLHRLATAGALDDQGWGTAHRYVRKLRVFLRQTGHSC